MKRFRPVNRTQLVSYTLFALSALLLAFTVYMTLSIDVITKWELIVPHKKIHVGDTVYVNSKFTKVRNTTGTSTRYIECKTADGVPVRYELNTATANRAPASGGIGIKFIVPNFIPDLPTHCRFSITVDYPVLPFRHVTESQSSRWFTVYPKESKGDDTQKTSQTPAPTGSPLSSSSSAVLPSSSQHSAQSNNPQQYTSQNNHSTNPSSSPPPSSQPPKQTCTQQQILFITIGTNCIAAPV